MIFNKLLVSVSSIRMQFSTIRLFLNVGNIVVMTIKEAIQIDSELLGGTPVFAGTRVSLKTMFDYLEATSLEDFLEGFPSVSREQAEVVIEWTSDKQSSLLNRKIGKWTTAVANR